MKCTNIKNLVQKLFACNLPKIILETLLPFLTFPSPHLVPSSTIPNPTCSLLVIIAPLKYKSNRSKSIKKLLFCETLTKQRRIENPVEHLQRSFFVKIVNGYELLIIFSKKSTIVDIRLGYKYAKLLSSSITKKLQPEVVL